MQLIQCKGMTGSFRVQVVDEGECADQTWRDELKELLEQPLS